MRALGWIVGGLALTTVVFLATFFGPGALVALVLIATTAGAVAITDPRRRAVAVRAMALCLVAVVVNSAVILTGVPGIRGSIWELNRVADKINACAAGAASVDVWRGGIVTIGEPADGPHTLTADERRLVIANGKVGLCLPAIS